MKPASVVIPARYASTRLAGKPLADILGKPMIQRVYEQAVRAALVRDVVVATDDEKVLKAVAAFGGRAVMTSSAHTSGTDRVAEAARSIDSDIIVNLQGDEPLITPDMIDAAIRPLVDDPLALISTIKTRITDERDYADPNAVKVIVDKGGWAIYFSRSPIPYARTPFKEVGAAPYKHIGLYVFRKKFLFEFSAMKPTALERLECLEQLRALENGIRIKVVEVAGNPVAVDTQADLDRVVAIVKGAPQPA